MSRQAHALGVLCAAVAVTLVHPASRADVITQTSTLTPTTTNFSSSSGQVTPLVFQKFDTEQGTRVLDSVTLNFSAQVSNQFAMKFVNPATITDSVASGDAKSPGPVITLYQPDGKTPLVTAQEPNDPSVLTKSATYTGTSGQTFPQTFSSSLPTNSPYYIPPTVVTATGSQTLTSAAQLALFTASGTGSPSIALPVLASAVSSFKSSSGNGSGSVSTQGTASVTVSYTWHKSIAAPETVPEPATVFLWSAAGAVLMAARRVRRVRARA